MIDQREQPPRPVLRPGLPGARNEGNQSNLQNFPGVTVQQRLAVVMAGAKSGWRRWGRRLVAAVVFAPSILTAIYYTFIASDRYVSEAYFVVRTAAKPSMSEGLGSLLQMTGMSRSQDDAFSVHEFITSRDALAMLSDALPIRNMFGSADADLLAGYPSILYDTSKEDLFAYYRSMVKVSYSSVTGISHLTVDAFSAEEANAIASKLLDLSENLVNQMNRDIQDKAVSFAKQDVADAQDMLVHSQALVNAFRNRESTIDPDDGAMILTAMTGKLSADLAAFRAHIAELEATSPNSPHLPVLRNRAAAIEAQIAAESKKVAGEDGIARKMSEYETLIITHEFASEDYARALAALEIAKKDARTQQLFLERVVQPSTPDTANSPRRFQTILSVFVANLIILLIGWFVWNGARDHAARP